jgi:type IV pilus assembly protein PilV
MSNQSRNGSTGFSLVEVMVALLVISVGMLGIAKMQALALSSTGSARTRSIAALEAASLGATMEADRAYWSGIAAANFTITVPSTGTYTGPTPADANLVVPTGAQVGCASPTLICTAGQLAAQDLSDWTTDLHSTVPNSQASIVCNPGANPNTATCNITITWSDTVVVLNTATNSSQTNAQATAAAQNFAQSTATYTLFVQP